MPTMSDVAALEDAAAPTEGEFVTYPDSPFQLFRPYPPAGDQPEAIEGLVEGIRDGLASRRCSASPAPARPSRWPT